MSIPTSLWRPFAIETFALVETIRSSIVLIHTRGGHGCGVIWDNDGLIITNDHVVGRGPVEVELRDGRRLPAAVVARYAYNDLAALRVQAYGLPAAPIGDSTALRVGEIILAVGHPLGVRDTATLGIVSAVGNATWMSTWREQSRAGQRKQEASEQREFLQADVALAPGNSGGPLTNAAGEVVGIASMILSPGIALAVPSHVVTCFVNALPHAQQLAA